MDGGVVKAPSNEELYANQALQRRSIPLRSTAAGDGPVSYRFLGVPSARFQGRLCENVNMAASGTEGVSIWPL